MNKLIDIALNNLKTKTLEEKLRALNDIPLDEISLSDRATVFETLVANGDIKKIKHLSDTALDALEQYMTSVKSDTLSQMLLETYEGIKHKQNAKMERMVQVCIGLGKHIDFSKIEDNYELHSNSPVCIGDFLYIGSFINELNSNFKDEYHEYITVFSSYLHIGANLWEYAFEMESAYFKYLNNAPVEECLRAAPKILSGASSANGMIPALDRFLKAYPYKIADVLDRNGLFELLITGVEKDKNRYNPEVYKRAALCYFKLEADNFDSFVTDSLIPRIKFDKPCAEFENNALAMVLLYSTKHGTDSLFQMLDTTYPELLYLDMRDAYFEEMFPGYKKVLRLESVAEVTDMYAMLLDETNVVDYAPLPEFY